MRLPLLSTLALSMAASAASAAPSFQEICMNTKDPGARNTIEIMMEAVKVDKTPTEKNCALAESRLTKLSELRLSATRYTRGDFEHKALNPLKTIEPITTLPNLKKLTLLMTHIDLRPLTELPQLEDLQIGPESMGFRFTVQIDVGPLAGLKAIKRLSLWHSGRMHDTLNMQAIANLTTLEELDIGFQNLKDSSLVANLKNLRKLYIRSNPFTDLKGLAGLTELVDLDIGYVAARDLQPLANLHKLRVLQADGIGLKDIGPLSALTNLENLNLTGNHLESLDALAKLAHLKELSAGMNTELASIEGLRTVPLEKLYLFGERLTDISAVGSIQTLKVLNLERNRITDIRSLAGLKNLEELGLSENQIADASPLGSLGRLRKLNLGQNKLTTLAGLENLKLEDLTVHYNEIASLEPLSQMKTLKRLSINGNPIHSVAPLAGLINLESLIAFQIPACDFDKIENLKQPHRNSEGKIIETSVYADTSRNCR